MNTKSVLTNGDLLSGIIPYLGDQYLYSGGLSKKWKSVFEQKLYDKQTRAITLETNIKQFKENIQSIMNKPGTHEVSPNYLSHISKRVMNQAALLGRTDMIKVIHENGHAPVKFSETCSSASYGGNLETLIYLRSIGCPWDDETVELAASRGHIAIVMWAIRNNCDWNHLAVSAAAMGGHLNIIKWIRKNTRKIIYINALSSSAALGGLDSGLDVIKWIRSIIVGESWMPTIYSSALKGGNLKILDYLHNNGCEWNHLAIQTVRHCKLSEEVKQWVYDHGQ